LIRSRRNASVQRKSSNLSDSVIEGLVTGRQHLQGEHLAAQLLPNGDAVGDRRTQELFYRAGFERVASQIAVLGFGVLRRPTSCIHAVVRVAFQ
jgi:hypothetical protein